MAHGVGEHMGRYERLGQFLAENGILVYGHDHGKDIITIINANSFVTSSDVY